MVSTRRGGEDSPARSFGGRSPVAIPLTSILPEANLRRRRRRRAAATDREHAMPKPEVIVEAISTYCRAETAGGKDAFMALFAEQVLHEDPLGIAIRHSRSGL